MVEERQSVFDEYMEEFTKLDKSLKNKEIVEKEKMIIAYLMNYAEENNIKYDLLTSREINDILDEEGTDDDYLEAMMVYLHNIEELAGSILYGDRAE